MSIPSHALPLGGQTAALLAALFLPSAGVAFVRFGLPIPGPAVIHAAQVIGEPLPLPVRAATRSGEQTALAAIFAMEAGKPFGPGPMVNRAADVLAVVPAEPPLNADFAPEVTRPGEVPVFTLSSMMGTARNPMAVVNGRLRRAGENVATGWQLTTIDLASESVTIVSEAGAEVRVALPARGVEPR